MRKKFLSISLGLVLACGVLLSGCGKESDATNDKVATESKDKVDNKKQSETEKVIEAYKKCFEDNNGVKCTLLHLNNDNIPEFMFSDMNEQYQLYTYDSEIGLIQGNSISPDINGYVMYLNYNEKTKVFSLDMSSNSKKAIDRGILFVKIAEDCKGFDYLSYLVEETRDNGEIYGLATYSFNDNYNLINKATYEESVDNYEEIYSTYGKRDDFQRVECDYDSVDEAFENLEDNIIVEISSNEYNTEEKVEEDTTKEEVTSNVKSPAEEAVEAYKKYDIGDNINCILAYMSGEKYPIFISTDGNEEQVDSVVYLYNGKDVLDYSDIMDFTVFNDFDDEDIYYNSNTNVFKFKNRYENYDIEYFVQVNSTEIVFCCEVKRICTDVIEETFKYDVVVYNEPNREKRENLEEIKDLSQTEYKDYISKYGANEDFVKLELQYKTIDEALANLK